MPQVGTKHFAYSKSGVSQAKTYAKKTGLELVNKPRETTRKPHGSVRKRAGTAQDESQNYQKLRMQKNRGRNEADDSNI